ncbi:MAG TPA: DUF1264 domain-containing protein [Candidatus Angelobacter sp.]|nr:DUF1264 domain-containing protein [Candidatus Angelobacter sp.]
MKQKRILWIALMAAALAASLPAQQPKTPTPADGYTVHVSAPHVVNGKIMGPFHHYCKVMAPDPVIVCLIYDTTDANATLTQVEYIVAKKLTRQAVSLENWNKYWHDHQQEIATGRVQVHDLPADKAKEVADLVATTDGIIFSFDFNGNLPTGRVTHPQAVGHKPMTAADYEKSRKENSQQAAQ